MTKQEKYSSVEEGLLDIEKRKINQERLLRSHSTQTFLDESSNELRRRNYSKPTSYNKRLSYVMLNCTCTLFFLWVMVYIFFPSSDIDISWDKTILDIETSSVTRSVRVDIQNNNYYANKLKNLYIKEYVRTCNDSEDSRCDWQLVEEYSQEKGYLLLDGYEDIEMELNSVHKGIDVGEALDISEACLYNTLTIKFTASWKFSGTVNYFNNDIEKIYCEIKDPYELSLSSYAEDFKRPKEVNYVSVEEELLENDRIEQIKYNLRHSDYYGRNIKPPEKPDPHILYDEDPHKYRPMAEDSKDSKDIYRARQKKRKLIEQTSKKKLRGQEKLNNKYL